MSRSPRLALRSVSVDDQGIPHLVLRRGNQPLLARLEGERLVYERKIASSQWWAQVIDIEGKPHALTMESALGAITVYDLSKESRGRKLTIDGESSFYGAHRVASSIGGHYAVGAKSRRLYRLDGGGTLLDGHPERWRDDEKEAVFYAGGGRSVHWRRVDGGPDGWRRIGDDEAPVQQLTYDQEGQLLYVVTSRGWPLRNPPPRICGTLLRRMAHDRTPGSVFAVRGDEVLSIFGTEESGGLWSVALAGGKLFCYQGHLGVCEIDTESGEFRTCGIDGQIARDQNLLGAGDTLYFCTADTLHRYDSSWSTVDIAGATLDEAPAVTRAAPTPRRESSSEATLLAEARAAADDPSALAVIADSLQELGHPAGEFIALQLLEEPSKAQSRRIAALFREHRATFMGPLATAFRPGSAVFRWGFLREVGLKQNARRQVDELRGHSVWNTVERLDCKLWDDEGSLKLIDDPAMESLVRVEGLREPESIAHLDNLPWVALELSYLHANDIDALCELNNLPELRQLTFNAQDLAPERLGPLWSCPVVRGLETLKGRCQELLAVAHLWDQELGHLRALTWLPGGMDRGGGWTLDYERRDDDTTALRFSYHWPNPRHDTPIYRSLARLLRALPELRAVSTVEIVEQERIAPTASQKTTLEKAVSERFGIEPTWVG